jgi:hypothetical protein
MSTLLMSMDFEHGRQIEKGSLDSYRSMFLLLRVMPHSHRIVASRPLQHPATYVIVIAESNHRVFADKKIPQLKLSQLQSCPRELPSALSLCLSISDSRHDVSGPRDACSRNCEPCKPMPALSAETMTDRLRRWSTGKEAFNGIASMPPIEVDVSKDMSETQWRLSSCNLWAAKSLRSIRCTTVRLTYKQTKSFISYPTTLMVHKRQPHWVQTSQRTEDFG